MGRGRNEMIQLNIRKDRKTIVYCVIALFIAVALVMAFLGNRFWQHMLFMIFLTAALSSSYNILAGFAGQLSLGHSIFFGIGAYTSTILFLNYHISPWIGMAAASAIAAVLAIVIGYPCFRLRGPFFSLATMAIGQMILIGATEWQSLTNGANGLNVRAEYGVVNLMFSSKIVYMLLAFFMMAAVAFISRKIQRSKMGYYLAALRGNEDAAESLGINTTRTKITALVISGVLTSILGVIYAQYIWYIEPASVFSQDMSLQWIITTVIGGIGTVAGPILGSILLVPLSEFIRITFGAGIQGLHLVIYAVLLILVVILMPKGIMAIITKHPKGDTND
jgi:branched-chain amino acid transport system permease protein